MLEQQVTIAFTIPQIELLHKLALIGAENLQFDNDPNAEAAFDLAGMIEDTIVNECEED